MNGGYYLYQDGYTAEWGDWVPTNSYRADIKPGVVGNKYNYKLTVIRSTATFYRAQINFIIADGCGRQTPIASFRERSIKKCKLKVPDEIAAFEKDPQRVRESYQTCIQYPRTFYAQNKHGNWEPFLTNFHSYDIFDGVFPRGTYAEIQRHYDGTVTGWKHLIDGGSRRGTTLTKEEIASVLWKLDDALEAML